MRLIHRMVGDIEPKDLFWLTALPMVTWPIFFYIRHHAKHTNRNKIRRAQP